MVTRSGAGGSLPPAVGVITDRVIAKRPDLSGMEGSTVRAPSKLDIASAEGSIRVWVDQGGMGEEGDGDTFFPTVVLSADELRLACQVHGEGGCRPDEESGGYSVSCCMLRFVVSDVDDRWAAPIWSQPLL
jgi:hypothetical protein